MILMKEFELKHRQSQTEWEQEMSEKILPLIRDSLYMDFRYLDVALNALTFRSDQALHTLATDGIYLRYSSEQILRLYPKNPLFLNRAFLHSTLHCIYRHLFIRGGRDAQLWNIACDIAAEWTIDHLNKPSVRRILSGKRASLYQFFEKQNLPVTAANLYIMLTGMTPGECQDYAMEFYVDDHRFWPADPKQSPSAAKAGDLWDKIGRQASQDMKISGEDDGDGAKMMRVQVEAGKSRRSYADFLRKFTVLQEEMHINEEEFDLGYYSYGLRLYDNLPLIEPLESREVTKIAQFVIVLDTSYSTSGDLVKRFLTKTMDIIRQRQYFFDDCQIHIIQCDSKVQAHDIVRKEADIDRILRTFDLTGGGNTDFRPAFSYVKNLLEEGELTDLRGLLYFTDGKGIYPVKNPGYRTAFVFVGPEDTNYPVPAWAMKIHLEKEDML